MLSYEDERFLPQAPGILGEMERNGLDIPGLEHLGRKVNKEHEVYGSVEHGLSEEQHYTY